jgi:hypothetical protein
VVVHDEEKSHIPCAARTGPIVRDWWHPEGSC